MEDPMITCYKNTKLEDLINSNSDEEIDNEVLKFNNEDYEEENFIETKKSELLTNYSKFEEIEKDKDEEILNENKQRLTIKPIDPKYSVLFQLYKYQRDAIWHPEEIDFVNDATDFEALPDGIQIFIEKILAFFAGSDTIVNINIEKNLSKITIMEAKICYSFQTFMENIHGEVYSDQLLNIVKDTKKRDKLINAFKYDPSIKRMTEWAESWIDSDRRIGFSLVAFAIMEGVFFSGAFA